MATISTRTINRLLGLAVLFISLACSQVFAQTQDARTRVQASWITTAVTPEQVRYLAPLNVYQLRLEIYDAAGNRLYDSGAHFGNLLEWSWQDQQGQRLADGYYRGLVTYKDFSGQASQRAVTLRRQGSEAALQEDERGDWLTTTPGDGALAGLLVGHDGRDARLTSGRGDLSFRSGDFFAGQDVERMRLTSDGNLGLGIARPQARLDVAGLIRTSEGIVFPDGTVQTTAATGSSRGNGIAHAVEIAGAKLKGAAAFLAAAEPQQGDGTFGNINMTGATDLGGVRVSDIRLTTNTSGLRFTATPGLSVTPSGAAIQFWGNDSPFVGRLFLDSGALDTAALIFRTATTGGTITERMRVTSNGNIGIGITNPGSLLTLRASSNSATALEVNQGAIKVTGAGINTNTAAFTQEVTAGNIDPTHTPSTVINNPLTNGDVNAILIVTPVLRPGRGVVKSVFLDYNTGTGRWRINHFDGTPMTVGETFNVLVLKP